MFGGDFTETSTLDPNGKHLNTSGLAYFDYQDWLAGLESFDQKPPTAAGGFLGYLVVGHGHSDTSSIEVVSVLKAGIWEANNCFGLDGPRGFFEHKGVLYGYGNFGGGTYYGKGFLRFDQNAYPLGITIANGAVNAAAFFKNEFYLAGDFTELHQNPFPGLVRLKEWTSATDSPVDGPFIHAYFAENQLFISAVEQSEPATCRVFDVSGRVVFDKKIEMGPSEISIGLPGLGSGVYFFEIKNGRGRSVGKFVVDGF